MREHRTADFWQDVRREKRAVWIAVSSAVLLTLAWFPGYYTFFQEKAAALLGGHPYFLWFSFLYQYLADILLLVLIPVLIIRFVLHEPLRDFGLRLGDWRFGLKYCAAFFVILAPFLVMNGKDPSFYSFYPLPRELYGRGLCHMLLWELTYLVYYIAWEFQFRGYLQLGLEKRTGPVLALLIQMLPSVVIHIDRPFGECLSAVAGAWLLGVLAWRTRSILWPVLLHWYIGGMSDYFCYRAWVQAGGG